MAKRWKRGEMLNFLRGERALLATSRQMGKGEEYLSRTLTFDPGGYLSGEAAAQILDAYEVVANGTPSA